MINETVPEGFQKTEVGIIPNDWKVKIFGDISFMKGRIGWQGLKQSEFTMNPDEPFLITGMNFKDGEIRWDEVYHVPESRYQMAKEIQLKPNDVLITKDGTIGKLLYVRNIPYPHKATLNSHLLVFRPIANSYDPLYLYYNLSFDHFKNHIELYKSGTTFFGISQESISKYQIPLPPTIDEQTAIANALNDADELITRLEQLIAKKRLIKQGAMQELLKPKDDWEVKKLGEIANIVGGGTPSTFNLSYWNGNINWFTPTEIGKTKYTFESVRKITKQGLENCSAKLLQAGTILLTSRASIGDISILMNDACTNQGFQSLVPKSGFSNEFVYYLMLTIKNLLVQNASGSTFLEISPNKLKQIEVSVPVISEQTRIAQILSDMDAEIEALETKLAKYKMLKQGMMQNLLTGKIRLIVNGEL
jgi:type I restriction enzyme S subunit